MPPPRAVERIWVVAGLGVLTLLALLYAVPLLGERPLNAVYEAVTLPAILASGIFALLRARQTTAGSTRIAWSLIGLGGLSWGLGEAGWTYQAVVLGHDVPTPSWIDVPYLLNIPLMAAGALALAWRSDANRIGTVRLLDSLLVAGSIFLGVWVAVLRGQVEQSGLGTAAAVVTILYPVGDVVVLAALALACMRLNRVALRNLAPLLAGMFTIALGDLGFTWVYLRTGGYGTTGFDLAWTAGAWLIAWSALRPAPATTPHQLPAGRVEQWLPTAVLVPLVFLLAADIWPSRHVDPVTLSWAMALGILLIVRQALLLDVHLRLSRSLLQTQMAAGLGAWSWDDSRRRLVLSDPAMRLLAVEGPTAMAFGDLLLHFEPDDRAGLEADWNALVTAGRPFERVVRVQGSAPPRHVKMTGQAGERKQGTLLDVTRDVQLRDQEAHALSLKAEAERLAELNRLKAQFINMAAHELNTPLTPITVSLATLKRGDASKKPQAETLALLERNVDRLVRLLRDVLDSARLQSDRMRFDLRVVDLAALAQEAVEEQRLVAEERGLHLVLDAQGAPVQADAGRLGEVLANLLGNAVKFTPAGGTVRVTVERRGPMAQLSVQDTGRGIDPKDLPSLFQPFSQVGSDLQATPQGTGLGLYIARGIMERLQGRIWAESEGVGKGSVFRLELPLVDPNQAAQAGVATP